MNRKIIKFSFNRYKKKKTNNLFNTIKNLPKKNNRKM